MASDESRDQHHRGGEEEREREHHYESEQSARAYANPAVACVARLWRWRRRGGWARHVGNDCWRGEGEGDATEEQEGTEGQEGERRGAAGEPSAPLAAKESERLGALIALAIATATLVPAAVELWSVSLGIGITAVVASAFGL